MALESFLTKYNPNYMNGKRWEDEVIREDTPTLNVIRAELGPTAVTRWLMVQVQALNNVGNHFKMDSLQIQKTAEMILTRQARMTVSQIIAFFQWYATEGDERMNVDALNIIRSFAKYKDAIRREQAERDKPASSTTKWMKGGYTMTIEQVKALSDDELSRYFHALPREDGGVCLESGDAYMITGEYLKRLPGNTCFFTHWEEEVRQYLNRKKPRSNDKDRFMPHTGD